MAWLAPVLLAACASPHDYKFPAREPDQAYRDHRDAVKDCAFVSDKRQKANLSEGLYPEYDVKNHILEATEQGGTKYPPTGDAATDLKPASGDAANDFDLNFARIFNCYRKFRDWAKPDQKLAKQEFKQVLIYFNGGLNRPKTVHEQAERQVPSMLKDGYYPIFLVWPTGPIDTYLEQISFIKDGTRHGELLFPDAPLNFVGDLGQGLARAPMNYLTQIGRFLASTLSYDDGDKRDFFLHRTICRKDDQDKVTASGTDQRTSYLHPTLCRKDAPSEIAKSLGEDCRPEPTDCSRFRIEDHKVTAGRNLMTGDMPDKKPDPELKDFPYYGLFATRFLSTPLVDSLGKTMWENMLRRTRTTVRPPIEYDINLVDNLVSKDGELSAEERKRRVDHIEEQKQRFPNGIGVFAKFFTLLQSCIKAKEKRPDDGGASTDDLCPEDLVGNARKHWHDVELTVIGHSMGTIVMNELIPLHLALPYRNLVFMAAAASVRDSARAMSPTIINGNSGERKETPLRFYNLMLHPQNDANELVAFGAGPSGSLLAWVDEMYEAPKTAIDRTMGKWRNLRATRHVFPAEARQNMLFRVFDWAGGWEKAQGDPSGCKLKSDDRKRHPQPLCYLSPITHSGFNDDDAHFWCPYFWGADKVNWWGSRTGWPAKVCPAPSSGR